MKTHLLLNNRLNHSPSHNLVQTTQPKAVNKMMLDKIQMMGSLKLSRKKMATKKAEKTSLNLVAEILKQEFSKSPKSNRTIMLLLLLCIWQSLGGKNIVKSLNITMIYMATLLHSIMMLKSNPCLMLCSQSTSTH